MRFSIMFLCCAFCLISCHSESKPAYEVKEDTSSVNIAKFTSVDFETRGKFCTAMINQNYANFNAKKDYPVSLFITVNILDKKPDGLPTDQDNVNFNLLEGSILSQLAEESKYCYIGRTRMDRYRDMMLYIPEKDQKKVTYKLESIQQKESRVKEFVFEKDPEWEAVSEFYEAIKVK